MTKELVTPKINTWDNVWKNQYNPEENNYYLESERCGRRWTSVRKFIHERLKNKENLRALEIGAGRGTLSMLLHEEFGAEVNLLDFSEESIKISKDFFKQMNVEANFIKADALNLPEEIIGNFDFVYSGGLIEHFEDQTGILDAHFKAVKKGGFVIMSAPNAWCIPYRIYKFLAETFNIFEVGFEDPMTYKEFKTIAIDRQIEDYSIVGCGLLATKSDWFTFFFRPIKKIIYKIYRIKYVEKIRLTKEFKPERKNTFGSISTAYYNIITHVK